MCDEFNMYVRTGQLNHVFQSRVLQQIIIVSTTIAVQRCFM